jgi:hypothetical protein
MKHPFIKKVGKDQDFKALRQVYRDLGNVSAQVLTDLEALQRFLKYKGQFESPPPSDHEDSDDFFNVPDDFE